MTTNIAARIGQRLSRQGRRLKQALNIPVSQRYRDFTILLPAEHLLPLYQRQHPRYDRFLPHLAAALGADAAIIDVGANCGDTLAGMVERNRDAMYVCIEPDDGFFAYLQDNIARIRASLGQISVHAVQSLVGKSVGKVNLAGSGGSRHAVAVDGATAGAGAGGHASATLDSILAALPALNVRLLKSDVDGFDYDVLDSAAGLLAAQAPILFFEAQCDREEQLAGFTATIGWLESLGYRHWTAFDNFGSVVLRTADSGQIVQLLGYVWKQNQGLATRTIHYFDVLACTAADAVFIDGVVDRY
jgi:FkbM family methyltransferase